jgi:hypothetical protein
LFVSQFRQVTFFSTKGAEPLLGGGIPSLLGAMIWRSVMASLALLENQSMKTPTYNIEMF